MSKLFKRLLSLTLAMIMVLSMIPAGPFLARAEGEGVYKYTFAGSTALAYADLVSDVTAFTKEGFNTAYYFKYVGRTDKTSVSTSGIVTRISGANDFLAYRLTGLEDKSAIYNLSVSSIGSHNSGAYVYVLPGSITAGTLTADYLKANYTAVGEVGGTASTKFDIGEVMISASDIRDEDGSVLLVFANKDTNYNFRLSGATLTKTKDIISNTYNFVSNDGTPVNLNTFEAETPFDNGSWNILSATSQPAVSTNMTGNMNGDARYATIRLNGITGFGTATLKFTYTNKQTAPLDFYILPGNTAVENAKPSAEGFPETPDAQMLSYAAAGNVLSQTFTVTIDKTDVYNNSVILVIRGTNAGGTVNNRLEKLELTMIPEPDPDRDAAAAVDALIAAIGTVTLASEADILAARTAYEALTVEQKALVTGYQTLVDAEAALEEEKQNDPVANQAAADPVIALIAAIGSPITLNSEDAIVAAREAYEALTGRQQALVTNYDVLTAAEDELKGLLDQEAANAVIGAIDAIGPAGEVALEDETAIVEARALYTALTDDQKALVTNADALAAAEAALAALKQQAAVDEVIAKINAIGEVTLNSAAAISEARTAYNALSQEQKDAVTNYETLVDAEFALKDLRNPNPDPSTFDGIVYDFTKAVDILNVPDGGHPIFNNADLTAAYPNVLNYVFYASNKSAQVSNGYRPSGYQAIFVQAKAQDWFAVKVKNPGVGEYRFTFTYPAVYNANYSQKMDAYMLPISVVENAMAAAGEGATEASVISALLADKNFKAAYLAASKNIKRATNGGEADDDDIWGIVNVTSDEEYIVVFHAAENKSGGTNPEATDGVWISISGFNLTAPPSADDVAEAKDVDDQITAIGTVIRSSKDKIEAARAAYEALTDKQKELVEMLSVLEAAEQRLAVLLDPANPIEYIYFDPGYPKNNGYPTSMGLAYGDFIDYAKNGSFKPYASYIQTQSSFAKGKWYGLKFTVDNAGDYNLALNANKNGTTYAVLDVYFVRADELIQGNGNTKNQAFIDGLADSDYKGFRVDLADPASLNLTGVQLDAGEYVIVLINAGDVPMFNFSGFAITRTGDYTGPEKVIEQPLPDPNTDKLVYDFYYDGTPNGTKILNSAILEVMSKDYALNKINWKPVAEKTNTVYDANYSSTFQDGTDTKRYHWKGIASSTTVGEWMALQIKAPGTGKYDLILEHAKSVNGASVSSTYVIPVSALKDLSVESIEAAIADTTYKMISTVSYKGSGSGHVTEMGQVDFEKGNEYIIVFHATTNKHGSKSVHEGGNSFYEGFLHPQKLTVSKFVPPAPLDQKEVTYSFFREDQKEGEKVFGDSAFGALAADYIKGTSYWKPYAHAIGTALESYTGNATFVKGTGKNYKFEGIMTTTLPTEWIAFQIKSPGKGLYTLSLTYGVNTNCTNQGEIHIIPLEKLTGDDPVAAVDAALKSGDYKLQRDVNFKKGSEKYNSGKYGQFNFEYDNEYVVVFKAATNKHGSEALIQKDGKTAYQAFMILKEMKLTFATKVETFEEEEEVAPDVTGQADPEAAAAVIALIKAIGNNITLDSATAIQSARTAYDLLTDTQKALVTNYQTLVDAEAKLAELVSADDKVKADAVIEKIDAIGEVTLDSESKIVAARIAYTLLTTEQRALVTNYSKLLAAEAKLAELKGESNISPMDQASADAVEALIARIGTVTLDSEVYISAARNAYNALTDTQKLLVENYADLVAAEKTFAELKAELDSDAAKKDAAKRKAQQITIMVLSALVAVGAAGTVAIFAVPGLKEKFMALIAGLKKKK